MLQLPRYILRSSELQDKIKAEIIKAVNKIYVNPYVSGK